MTRADMDRDKDKKPGELKKELAEMVGRVADEQTRCRIEGWKAAMRFIDGAQTFTSDAASQLDEEGRKRWGPAFDA